MDKHASILVEIIVRRRVDEYPTLGRARYLDCGLQLMSVDRDLLSHFGDKVPSRQRTSQRADPCSVNSINYNDPLSQ